jgi:hypothetical protein
MRASAWARALPLALIASGCASRSTLLFEDVSERAGIRGGGWSFGASVGDFDGDGFEDLFLGNHFHGERIPGNVSLYRNARDGTFVDVAESVFEGRTHGDLHGAAWVDFDNDGDQDLYVAGGADWGSGERPKHFFVNDAGRGKLVESAARFGLDASEARGRTPVWLPWDRDSSLELLLTSVRRPDGRATNPLFRRGERARFEAVSAEAGVLASDGCSFAQLFGLDGRGSLGLLLYTTSVGGPRALDLSTSPPREVRDDRAPPPTGWVTDAVLGDFDGDGLVDLFLARAAETTEVLVDPPTRLIASFVVSGGEQLVTFRCAALALSVSVSGSRATHDEVFLGATGRHPAPMSFSVRRDRLGAGLVPHEAAAARGIYVGLDPATDRWLIAAGSPDAWRPMVSMQARAPIEDVQVSGPSLRDPALPGRLWLRRPDGGWTEATERSGLGEPLCARSAAGSDFDNDGDFDLFVVQGTSLTNPPDVLFENRGDGTFERRDGACGAAGAPPGCGDSVVILDFDRDGFQDLFVTNGEGDGPVAEAGRHQLFRNVGNRHHWLELDLVGTASNRDSIGAAVRLVAGGRVQVREQSGGMHRFSQDSRRLHFGLGAAARAQEVLIRWPSGLERRLLDVEADRILVVEEPDR